MEERSRAFGYLVAAGSVGQTVASVVSDLKCISLSIVLHGIWSVSAYFLEFFLLLFCTFACQHFKAFLFSPFLPTFL